MYFNGLRAVCYELDGYLPTDNAGNHEERKVVACSQASCSHPRKGMLMKPQVRKLRLRKSTLREVTSNLAQEVVGGSVVFTDGCTYATCANTCANTCAARTCAPSCGGTCDWTVCLCD